VDYQDAVRLFVVDCLLADVKARRKASDFFEIYQAYCEQMDLPPIDIRHFGKELSKYFHTTRANGTTKYWCSVRPDLVITEEVVDEAAEAPSVPHKAEAGGP
jgi:phage/plasmid-associated DNA primase